MMHAEGGVRPVLQSPALAGVPSFQVVQLRRWLLTGSCSASAMRIRSGSIEPRIVVGATTAPGDQPEPLAPTASAHPRSGEDLGCGRPANRLRCTPGGFIDVVAAGRAIVLPHRVYDLDDTQAARAVMLSPGTPGDHSRPS
jgi:hypothetical protein